MPDDREQRRLNSDDGISRIALMRWLSDSGNLRLLLGALYSRRRSIRSDALGSRRTAAEEVTEYLETCCEKALDAYTLEDAMYWHSEIMAELAVELQHVRAMDWPDTIKASLISALEDRINQHGAIVQRLTGLIGRNEQLFWAP
jgi:hypothetical protein